MDIKKEKITGELTKAIKGEAEKIEDSAKKLGKEIKEGAIKAAEDIKKDKPSLGNKSNSKNGPAASGGKKGI